MAQLYKVGERPQTISPKNGYKFELEEAQSLIGGWIELVRIGHGAIMLVDEEGQLKHLQVNIEASRIAGCCIKGTAIVCADNQF